MTEPPAPTFSVLCSAYRCEDYLAETIESVLAQTCPDWELIVVDNGMSDAVAGIVDRYRGDPRVRLIRQPNRGLIGGVRTAAAAAGGRYLVPLDSDDQLLPDFCRRMAEVLDRRPEIDALSCDAYLFVDGSELNQARSFLRHRVGLDHPLTVTDLVGRCDVIPYFAAVRRAAWFAAGGYAEGTELVEDIGLFLRLVASGRDVRVLPERLVRYRLRADSASHDPSSVEQFERNRERLYRVAAEQSADPASRSALRRRLRELRYEQALRRARWAFRCGDEEAARGAAREAYRQRRTLRSTAVVVGLYVGPTLLRRIHPVKQRVTARASRIAARVAARLDRMIDR
jgi:glycosyltransferase involved in cell wall biosynthesis